MSQNLTPGGFGFAEPNLVQVFEELPDVLGGGRAYIRLSMPGAELDLTPAYALTLARKLLDRLDDIERLKRQRQIDAEERAAEILAESAEDAASLPDSFFEDIDC